MATQFDDEWEYSTAPASGAPASSDDEWEYSAPPSGAGATTTATNPYGKMGADEEAQFSPDPLRIEPLRLPKPVEEEYYGMLSQNKGNAAFGQKDIDQFWTTRGYAPMAADDKFISAVREGKDTGRIDYSSWDKAQQGAEDDRMKRAMEDFSKEAYQGDYASAVDEGAQYGFWGITSRTLNDWFDTNKDEMREQFPNASDEELERLSDQDVIRRARAARNHYSEANKDSGWVPWLAGQATSAIDPTMFIAPGASAGGRVAAQTGVQMVTQGAYEGIDAAQGLPSGQAGENILLAGALGAGTQGLFELGGKLYQRIRGPQGEVVEEVINPTPEQIQGARLQQEAEAFQAGKANEPVSPLEQEAQAFQGSKDPTVEDVFPTPEQTAAKEAAMAEKLAGEAEAFKARGEEPEVVPEAPAAPKVTADQARESVDFITQDWTNAPDIEVVQSARDLGDDSIDPDALGFIGEDGKVRIIADNLSGPEDVRAVLFHEALGHHGLASKFGEELDDVLMRAYDSGGKFKKEVDDFIKERPDYVEAYADDVNPTARMIEEIFAGKSESGIVVPPNILAKMKYYLKDFARKMGITKWTDITDAEVRTILGMAHDATIRGKPSVVDNGFRYSKEGQRFDKDEEVRLENPNWSANRKVDSRMQREDTLLRREAKLKNDQSYDDWKRNWEFDEFLDELEANKKPIGTTEQFEDLSGRGREGPVVQTYTDAELMQRLAAGEPRYMKRQAGKGSEGPLQGSATREVKEKGDVNTPISKFRSSRDLTDITEEIMPERTKESWDEWIDEAGNIKMTAKAAENLATGTDVPHLKAAETLLLRTKNRIFDLSRKASNQTLSPRENESLRVELQRAKNIAQSIQDVVSNAARILNSRNIEVSDDRATGAMIKNMLRKIEEGKLNDPAEVQKMADALRKGDKKDKALAASLNTLTEALNLPRSIMSSMDLSAPLRQGAFFVTNKNWWKAIIPMFKQFAKEKHYDYFLNDIKGRPTFPLMMKSGLAIMSKEGRRLDQREEAFLGTWAEKIPVFGKGVEASQRAYTGFLNKLRADLFDDLVRQYHKAGVELYNLDKKGQVVIKEPKIMKDIVKLINNGTGRGDLGSFNQAAAELANALFSPRLLTSRVTMLRPSTYVKLDPIVRRMAVKNLLGFGGLAVTAANLAAMAFPDDVTVEWDPRSSDFMKIKVGNTRYDILGGFGQYLTLGARLSPQFMGGNRTKNAKGELKVLGEDFGSATRLEVLAKFFGNKEAPLASLLTDYLRGSNAIGEPFAWDEAVISRMVPMLWQDMADLVKDRGAVGIPMAIPAVFGVGSQTYNIDLGVDAFGRDIAKLQKKKEPESDPVVLEVSALGERTDENPLSKAPKSFKYEGQKYELTDEQVKEWQQIMGDLQHQFLAEDITSSEWLDGDDEEKLKIAKKAHTDAFAQTKEHFLTTVFGVTPSEEEEVESDDDFIYE